MRSPRFLEEVPAAHDKAGLMRTKDHKIIKLSNKGERGKRRRVGRETMWRGYTIQDSSERSEAHEDSNIAKRHP